MFFQGTSEHGTAGSYTCGCRCVICRRYRIKELKKQRHAQRLGKEPPKHGTASSYVEYGCRCEVCVKAKGERYAAWISNPKVLNRQKERGWKNYGIKTMTYVEFCRMFDEQHGQCLICMKHMKKYSKNRSEVANVDHDHETGKIRGLLCSMCNIMIGLGGTSLVLRSAAKYLNDHVGCNIL